MSKKKRLKALFSHWVSEPTLRSIACHLHEKTEMFTRVASSGFRGEANAMERQIIEHLSGLRQQVLVHTDVMQALLIIEDERILQKMKRAFRWIWEAVKKLWHRVKESTLYKILAAVGVLASLWPIKRVVVWLFHLLRGYMVHRR